MKHKQNNQISIGNSIPIYRFKNLKKKVCEPKVSILLPHVFDFKNEIHTLGHGLLFFVISISVWEGFLY